jgi:transcriptional regulator
MTSEEQDEIVNELEGINTEVSCIIQDAIEKIKEANSESDNLRYWKNNVLNSLPKGCSLKFRMDVEEMLDKIKSVY